MPHIGSGETSGRNEFGHRIWPSSPDNRVLNNACLESPSQFIKLFFKPVLISVDMLNVMVHKNRLLKISEN